MDDNTATKELIAFLRGSLGSTYLPEEIELDKSLWQAMDELWQRSVQHITQGWVSEWGGVLVLDEDDNLKLTNIMEGTEERLSLQLTTQETRIGSFHTHPYPDGTTGIAFSGADIADAINSDELMSVVQSGRDVFVIFRTETTPLHVEVQFCRDELDELHQYYLGRGMMEPDAIFYANHDVCERYNLCFYMGLAFQRLWEVYKP